MNRLCVRILPFKRDMYLTKSLREQWEVIYNWKEQATSIRRVFYFLQFTHFAQLSPLESPCALR